MDFLENKKLLLASKSPRRRELLGALGMNVELAPLKDVSENFPVTLPAEEVPLFISAKKARAYVGEISSDAILVTADTVVISRGNVLGKPRDKKEAERMLESLSGRTHKVVTGVTLATNRRELTFGEQTLVTFAELSNDEIEYYVNKYLPLDKAGAYGIQEWIGYIGVSGIEGDYYNVMGLPLHALYKHIKQFARIC